MPTFLYRMTFLSDWLTPYAGLGLRIYLLESTVNGTAGDQSIADTTEHSTKLGFGVPLGVEFALGPGGITAELLFQWAPLEHTLTGDSHLGGLSLFVGYRFLL
jgi:opacity protein-like surface antigen